MKVILYCRTASIERDRVQMTLKAQEEVLIREAAARGFEYTVVRDDVTGGGGHSSDKLAEVLDLLDQHQADVLMAVRLDWILEGMEGASAFDRSQRQGWGIMLSGDCIEKATAKERLGPRLKALSMSEERALISRRTREAMQRQKAEGALFGRPVDPGFVVTYREVIAMVERGMSFNAVARSLNDQGIATAKGRTWYASTVKAMVESETARRIKQAPPQTG
ncbi:MAG: recombinase family protein [Pseudolysinimonas sp.]